ncbi:SapC family protein [uncultured Methylobacterium sp.]|uniref:SapC family protein n=1 Tax=uncultured Methylobacterium sp. TaxID=157278 RepID=UPI0035C9950A
MSDLPLFYRSIVPLDRERHRELTLLEPQEFGFARGSHLVPAVVDEFGPACRHLPILFLPESLGPTPVFLTGFRPGASALVDAQGTWTGRYLPAYLRRYPFILGEVDGADPLICFDDTSGLLAAPPTEAAADSGDGWRPLFEAGCGDSPVLAERIRLVIDYAAAARRTASLGRLLQDLALLRPLTIERRDPASGESHALHGVLGIDEAALAALPEAGFARLREGGWLSAIYAHLVSLQSIRDFTQGFAGPGSSSSISTPPSDGAAT